MGQHTSTTTQPVTVVHVDPATLLVDSNVRHDLRVDREFVASIKEHGVLVPIVAIRCDDGIRVRYGHRRTLAAIEAARATVPVIVLDDDTDEALRVVTQYVENEHRAGLTTAEKIGVFEQLAEFGLCAAQIARRTKVKRADIDTALAVAGSALAKAASDRYDWLTLDQAAAVAEFDGDSDAVKALVTAAKTGQFEHTAQRLRDQRDERDALDALRAQVEADGVTVIDQPGYHDAPTRLADLTNDGEALAADTHAACPGHAAYLTTEYGWSGGEGDADDDLDDQDDYDDEEPARALTDREWIRRPVAVYVCTDPAGNGHAPRHTHSHNGAPTQTGPLSDEQKAERRRVLDNNKAWRSAESVRRDWLRTFLARKTLPKGAATYIAETVGVGHHTVRRAMESGHVLARDLLGCDTATAGRHVGAEQITALVERASEPRALVITLALILAAQEHATGVHTWRNPSRDVARYLTFLAANGYSLSDVETLAGAADSPPDGDAA